MTPRLLTVNGWKPIAQRSHARDNGLQRALLTYERLAEDKLDERVEALEEVKKLATNLSKVREVASVAEAKDYLEDVAKAAEDERKKLAPQAARADEQLTKIKTWAAKIKAADGQKPDFAKLKRLLTEMGTLAKRPVGRGAGSGAGKGGERDPCAGHLDRMHANLLLFSASAIFAASVVILAAAAWAAAAGDAAILISLRSIFSGNAGRAIGEAAGRNPRAVLDSANKLAAALVSLALLWRNYNDAWQSWDMCRERLARDAAQADYLAEHERHQQLVQQNAEILRQAELVRRWGTFIPDPLEVR
jgi:hypothetical protein